MAFYGIASGLGEWSNISGDLLRKKRENDRVVWNDDVLHATSY